MSSIENLVPKFWKIMFSNEDLFSITLIKNLNIII